jgi:hypothetical protein
MVPFHSHPGDRICAACAGWLYSQSRTIARRNNPLFHLPSPPAQEPQLTSRPHIRCTMQIAISKLQQRLQGTDKQALL